MSPKPLLLLLAVLAVLAGCTHLRVEPKGALDGVSGDLLLLIDGIETSGPPTLMVNAKKAAASFAESVTVENICAGLAASLQEAAGVGRVECQALQGVPAAFTPSPSLQFRLGRFDMPLPVAGAKVVRAGFAPPWALILDGLYVGYEHRSAGNNGGSYPVIKASARLAWWSNGDGRAVAWGQDAGVVRTAGWIAPESVGSSVSEAITKLGQRIVRHAGLSPL